MIIIEGPRGAGKKTLANALALEFEVPIYDYGKQLAATGHISLTEVAKDLRGWESKEPGIYVTHPLITEYIYGPLLRKRGIEEFYTWKVRPIIEYFKSVSVIIYCRPSSMISDEALPYFDLLLRTPLASFRVWEYDYESDPEAQRLKEPVASFLRKAYLDTHHRKIGSRLNGRRKITF